MIRTTLNRNVEFNDSDKNFGPVLYSRALYLDQCKNICLMERIHASTLRRKKLILEDVTSRLKNLLNDFFGKESATKSLAQTQIKWAEDSLKKEIDSQIST